MAALLVIDDDELSREVLVLLAAEAGFACSEAESGAAALEVLAGGSARPAVVLADMQMPGMTGESLARLLRATCGPATLLLAMSGSEPHADALRGFDGFLLKPFGINDLQAAVEERSQRPAEPTDAVVLNKRIYASLADSMPRAQLRALYGMCLDDAEKRLHTLETAAEARDQDAYARAAHAIKGACGMVGAAELASLAGAMETGDLPEVGNKAPFQEFMAAAARLRRMLDAQTE